ncbi:squalene--hopene cyclase [Sorangium sp. So ce1335]|uniref:squalene--hopene cyclase n=1 Tax=Sorangium sp. So ce1335 TaxID=3133335 RepID=UPI003F5EB63F
MSAATARALSFLLRAQDEGGFFHDYALAAGEGDEWVTGYVGAALARLSVSEARRAAAAALAALVARAQRPGGAWGYNGITPGDADSTLWGLQLARAVGAPEVPRIAAARAALMGHYQADAGLSTYASEGAIRAFINAPPAISLAGWCSSHVCVTAAAAALPEMRDAVRPFLLAAQRPDGSFGAYWWQDDEYATALAALGLAGCGVAADRPRVAAAIAWAARRLGADGAARTDAHPAGSPFATAWCLRLLRIGAGEEAIGRRARAAEAWLRGAQRPDGSWDASARLRVPLPDDLDPASFTGWVYGGTMQGSVVLDEARVMTTATVLAALAG